MSEKIIFNASSIRETKEVTLPSIPGSKVEVYTKLRVADQRIIEAAQGEIDGVIATVKAAIKDWNLYKDEENKLDVSLEVLEQLPGEDMLVIFATAIGTTPEELNERGRKLAEARAGVPKDKTS